MKLKNFIVAFNAAKGVDASHAREKSQQSFVEKDLMMAGIYAIIAGDYGISMFHSVLLALNEREQTENIQMLLTEACRYNMEVGETHVLFVQDLKEHFKGDLHAVAFNAVYNSGITAKDLNFTSNQIEWFAAEKMNGYATKMLKRMKANFVKRVEALEATIEAAKAK